MKSLSAFFAFALLLTQSLHAQELSGRLPAPSALPAEVPLIPEEVPQNAKPRGGAVAPPARGMKTSKTDVSAAETRERIRFREAKTKALRDAQIQAQWERSLQAKTDYEKREALTTYYKLLYGRIAKLDGSIKTLIEQRKQYSLRRLEQDRIDPTVPFDPGE